MNSRMPVAAALVLALAGLVAVAPGGTPAWALLRDAGADRWQVAIDVAILFVLGFIAAASVTLILHRAIFARRAHAPPLRASLLRAVPVTTVALVVLSLMAIARAGPPQNADDAERLIRPFERSDRPGTLWGIVWPNPGIVAGVDRREPETPGTIAPDAGPGLPYPYLAILVIAILAGFAARQWYAHRTARPERRSADDETSLDTDREAVHDAVVDTIDAMLADPDPRTAIIGAYARLLEGLDARGTGRRTHEAPVEHLRRVLATLRVRPAPLHEITELFEIARFSTHLLTTSHRERALAALRDVAADLAVTSLR